MTRRSSALAAALSAALLPACGGLPGPPPSGGEEPILSTAAQALRPDTPGNGDIYTFDPADVVETFPSVGGDFLIHFTRIGPNAVPSADADASGIPDFVEDVASVYDQVAMVYEVDLGFRPPESDEALSQDNGGDARFDVYLVDFGGAGDGLFRPDGCRSDKPSICAGYMTQENDYKGYGYPSTAVANRILGSHEFFHAVQAAYDDAQDSVVREGTAVWATERFDPTLKDFEAFTGGFMQNVDRTLNEPLPGPVDPFSYGSCLFFQYMSERFGDAILPALWDRVEDGANGVADPDWFTELDPLLKSKAGSSFAEAFTEFATWNLFTGSLADPSRSYDAGSGYALAKMSDVAAPYKDDLPRFFRASSQYYRLDPGERESMTAAVVAHKDEPDEAAGLEVLLAVQRGKSLDPVLHVASGTAGTEAIDTKGADNLIVVVVNTNQTGSSKRPGLCIGAPSEVDACRAEIVPPEMMPMPDAGVPDAGTSPPPADDTSGCACDLGRRSGSSGALSFTSLSALFGYALLRRRRVR